MAYVSLVSRINNENSPGPFMVSAQFIDFSGADISTVRRSLGLWSPEPLLQADSCEFHILESPPTSEAWYTSNIELLHAGPLVLATSEDHIALNPRPIPELLPYFNGYTYGTTLTDSLIYQPNQTLVVGTPGGQDVDSFLAVIQTPQPINIDTTLDTLQISDEEIHQGTSVSPLLLEWEPAEDGSLVYFSVEPAEGTNQLSLVCAAFDDGRFHISTSDISRLNTYYASRTLRLIARRANTSPLYLEGFDISEVVATTQDTFLFQLD
jgi:hypothetical protein